MERMKFKILFHFRDKDPVLEGFYVTVEAYGEYSALNKVSKCEWWSKYWQEKWVCVNMKNVSYLEVVGSEVSDSKETE